LVFLFYVINSNPPSPEFIIKTPQQLGPVLQGYRKQRRLTQSQAGAKVGLAQNVVSAMEKDPQRAGLARVFKLLAALDLELVVRPRGRSSRPSEW
jgi:HTH-type transcriptional regulator/antitoxin HipB